MNYFKLYVFSEELGNLFMLPIGVIFLNLHLSKVMTVSIKIFVEYSYLSALLQST